MDLDAFASALGALGIGSLMGQYLTQGRERRTVRTDVLAALEACESARWSRAGDTDEVAAVMTTAVRKLESAAVVSGLPAKPVDQYIVLAWAARWTSYDDVVMCQMEGRDEEFAGGIPTNLADVVSAAARDVARLVWSPWRGRLIARRGVKARRAEMAKLVALGDEKDATERARNAARFVDRARTHMSRHSD